MCATMPETLDDGNFTVVVSIALTTFAVAARMTIMTPFVLLVFRVGGVKNRVKPNNGTRRDLAVTKAQFRRCWFVYKKDVYMCCGW